ncbi:hypothetical protein M5K25_026499 [Dendrobium thyrsiflorum]|uniref:Protein FAR1-RELATED SEQUENCE n=1 Tax=Dendrobium thyrsiflorum TaxID=117978 RepID=A0ABD0TXJ0_DENTH
MSGFTAFNKDYFNIVILSTQHSESINNVCHGIFKPTSFITDYFLGLEKQAAHFYSRKLFSFFEEEFLQGVGGMSSVLWKHSMHLQEVRSDGFTMFALHESFEYLLLRWSARDRKDIYSGQTLKGSAQNNSEASSGFIFGNYISRFAYQISTRVQMNEEAEQYMLAAMKDMSENIDLILNGKRKNHKFPREISQGGIAKVKDPIKHRPKGVSNAMLKSHWEKNKGKRKSHVKEKTSQMCLTSNQCNSTRLPKCFTEEFISGASSNQSLAQ